MNQEAQIEPVLNVLQEINHTESEQKKESVKKFFETFCYYLSENKPEPVDKKRLLAESLIKDVDTFLDEYQLKETLANALRNDIFLWCMENLGYQNIHEEETEAESENEEEHHH